MAAPVLQRRCGISAQPDGRSLQREASRGQQSTTILSESAVRVDAQCTGWGASRPTWGPGTAVLCCASTALVAEGRSLSAAATELHVGARGHAQKLGTTL